MSRFLHKLAISILYSNVIWIKFRKKKTWTALKTNSKIAEVIYFSDCLEEFQITFENPAGKVENTK